MRDAWTPIRYRRRVSFVKSLFHTPVPALEGREALRTLSARGPHRVLRGNLGPIGLPGGIYSPERGSNLPAVAFAHGWIVGAGRYRRLLEHLASWGFVVAAPDTERNLFASPIALANDLFTVLDAITNVRLGTGSVSVDPRKLGLIGHGMGGSVAVLAAARRPPAAVAALFPAPTAPAAQRYAGAITAPAVVVAGHLDIDSRRSNARTLAAACATPARLCSIDDASQDGIVEGRGVLTALGAGKPERRTARITSALLTGYLLATLTDDPTYRAFAGDRLGRLPHTTMIDPSAEPEPNPKPSPAAIARALLGR